MQKRVIGYIDGLAAESYTSRNNSTAATKATATSTAKAAGEAKTAKTRGGKSSFGRAVKFAVVCMLLVFSVFCAIGSADWIISQQVKFEGSSESYFNFDEAALQAHINIKAGEATTQSQSARAQKAAKNTAGVSTAKAATNYSAKTSSASALYAANDENGAATYANDENVATYANESETSEQIGRATYNGAELKAFVVTSGVANAAGELPEEAIKSALTTKYVKLSSESDKLPSEIKKYFENATEGMPSAAGTYAIYVTINGFDGTVSGQKDLGFAVKIFTITPCPVAIAWSGQTLNGFTYDGTAHTDVTATATVNTTESGNTVGAKANVTVGYDITRNGKNEDEIKNAGEYTLTAKLTGDNAGNYTITSGETTKVTVNKATETWNINPTLKSVDSNGDFYTDGRIIMNDNYVGYCETKNLKATVTNGQVAVMFAATENGTYSQTQPKTSGTYYAKFYLAESENYKSLETIITYTITHNVITYKAANGTSTIATENCGRSFALRKYAFIETFQYAGVQWTDGTTLHNPEDIVTGVNTDKTYMLVMQEQEYTVNIYYKDKDNQVSSVKTNSSGNLGSYNTNVYDFINKIGATTLNKQTANTTLTLKKQIRLNTSYDYYTNATTTAKRYINGFYMSPLETLKLTALATGYNKSGYSVNDDNYLAYIKDNTITLVVLCVQPQAIVSTSNITTSENLNYTDVTYYANMNDAFAACQNVSANTYLRIYGQAQYAGNTFAYHCLTANKTIAAYSFTINSKSFTVPKYTLDISGYTLSGTRFSNNYTINNNLKVILPHGRDDSTADGYLREQTSATIAGSYIQSIMTVPQGFTLTVNGALTVGATLTAESEVNAHAVLMNNGKIIISNGKELIAMGYVKGTGSVEAQSGGTVSDVFRIYNFPGGTNAVNAYKSGDGVFPFNVYSFHNISCKTVIPYGSIYQAWAQLYMGGSWVTKQYITILGNGGMFALTSPDGKVVKNVEDTTATTDFATNFTSSNQNVTQREIIDIYGNFNDNTVSVKAKALIFTETIQTNQSLAMPIGFMNINIKTGNGTLSASSYNFLPGSRLTIDNNASLTIAEGTNVIFFDDFADNYIYTDSSDKSGYSNSYSYRNKHYHIYGDGTNAASNNTNNTVKEDYHALLTVNGTININGSIGGTIKSSDSSGTLKISNTNNATTKVLSTLKYNGTANGSATFSTESYSATGDIITGIGQTTNNANLSANTTYQSYEYDGNYYWITDSAIKTIKFDTNGGTPTSINSITDIIGATITLPSSSAVTKNHYVFAGWKSSADGKIYTDTITIPDNGATLTAQWTAKTYTINFKYLYNDDELQDGVTNTNPSTFTFETKGNFAEAIHNEYNFENWYLDENCTQPVSKFSDLLDYLNNDSVTVYGLFTKENVFLVTYDKNGNKEVTVPDQIKVKQTEASNFTPDSSFYDENNKGTSKKLYFLGWYTDKDGTMPFDPNSFEDDITLYAKWAYKAVVEVTYHTDSDHSETVWLTPEQVTNGYTIETSVTGDYRVVGILNNSSNVTITGTKLDETKLDSITITIGSVPEMINVEDNTSAPTATITLDVRKVFSVTINMSAYYQATGWSSKDYFEIDSLNLNGGYYSADKSSWTKDNPISHNKTGTTTFYVLSGKYSNGSFTQSETTVKVTTTTKNKLIGSAYRYVSTPSSSNAFSITGSGKTNENFSITIKDSATIEFKDYTST